MDIYRVEGKIFGLWIINYRMIGKDVCLQFNYKRKMSETQDEECITIKNARQQLNSTREEPFLCEQEVKSSPNIDIQDNNEPLLDIILSITPNKSIDTFIEIQPQNGPEIRKENGVRVHRRLRNHDDDCCKCFIV